MPTFGTDTVLLQIFKVEISIEQQGGDDGDDLVTALANYYRISTALHSEYSGSESSEVRQLVVKVASD